MKRYSAVFRQCAIYLSLALLTEVISVNSASAQPERSVFTIVNEQGQIIPGAIVRLYGVRPLLSLDDPIQSTAADQAGHVAVPQAQAERRLVVVYAPGYELLVADFSGGRILQLKAGRDVAYEIRSADHTVPGTISWSVGNATRVVVRSNYDGTGLLLGLPVSPVAVTVNSDQQSMVTILSVESARVAFVIPPSGSIEGRVVSDLGTPLTQAVILHLKAGTVPTNVDSQGRFTLRNLRPGRIVLSVSNSGFRSETIDVSLTQGQRLILPTIMLRKGTEIVARFIDFSTGEPVRRPQIVRETIDPSGFDISDVFAPRHPYVGAVDGSIVINDLPAGIARLTFDTPLYGRLRLPEIDISPDEGLVDLGTFVVGPGVRLEVSLISRTGELQRGVPVRLDQGPGLSPVAPAEASTNESGVAVLDRLGPGRYRLRVGGDERPGGTTAELEQWISVDQTAGIIARQFVVGGIDVTVTVNSISGPLAGVSTSIVAGDGEELPAVRGVVVQTSSRMINGPTSRRARGVTDASGRVTLRNVPIGAARLALDLNRSTWSIPVSANENNRQLNIQVPNTSASIHVVDRTTGTSIPAQAIWETNVGTRNSTISDTDGVLALDGLGAEGGTLHLISPGHVPVDTFYSSAAALPPVVSMDPALPLKLELTISGADGNSLKDATVELTQIKTGGWRRYATTDAAGLAIIDDIHPGEGRLIVRRQGYASHVATITIRSGVNNSGRIALRHGYRLELGVNPSGGADGETYRLQVADERGIPIEDALDDASPTNVVTGSRISIGLLAPGRYTLRLTNDRATHNANVTIKDSNETSTIQ